MQRDPDGAGAAEPAARLIDTMIRELGVDPHSDLAEDCRQEAKLALARLRERPPPRVSEQDRATYTNACARNAIRRAIRRDRRQRAAVCSVEDLRAEAGSAIQNVESASAADWEALIADTLLAHCERPEFIAALRALPAEDYR
jgi:DNA-directed RNA polymerase specialized sigma24 family protein